MEVLQTLFTSAKRLWVLYVVSTCAFSLVSSKILMVPVALIDSRIGLVQALVCGASWSNYRAFIVIGSVLLSPLALMAASKTIPQDDVPFATLLIRMSGGVVFLVSIAALIYFPHDMTPDKYINWRSSVFHLGRNSIIFFHFLIFILQWFASMVICIVFRSFLRIAYK